MSETRKIAADYYAVTGKTLPVSQALSQYDVCRLLDLTSDPQDTPAGINLIGNKGAWQGKQIQVKSRVLLPSAKSRPRVGQLNLNAPWDVTLLVLMNEHYHPQQIFAADKPLLQKTLEVTTPSNPRGVISVAKFRAIGELVWQESPSEPNDSDKAQSQ